MILVPGIIRWGFGRPICCASWQFSAIFYGGPDVHLLSATAYPARLGNRPLAYYKPVQGIILEFGGCWLDHDLWGPCMSKLEARDGGNQTLREFRTRCRAWEHHLLSLTGLFARLFLIAPPIPGQSTSAGVRSHPTARSNGLWLNYP